MNEGKKLISTSFIAFITIFFINEIIFMHNISALQVNFIVYISYCFLCTVFIGINVIKVSRHRDRRGKFGKLYEYKEEKYNKWIGVSASIAALTILELIINYDIKGYSYKYLNGAMLNLYIIVIIVSIITLVFYFTLSVKFKNKIYNDGIELSNGEFKSFNDVLQIDCVGIMFDTAHTYVIKFNNKKNIKINFDELDFKYITKILEENCLVKINNKS